MKHDNRILLSRRTLVTGLVSAGGGLMSGCSSKQLPPTYGNVLRMGDLLTYRAFRTLLPPHALAREYARGDISSSPAVGTSNPADPHQELYNAERGARYDRLRTGGFAEWRLQVSGQVANPRTFSLAQLQGMQSRTQITKHTCEEGWSAIAEWTGVPLRAVLEAAGVLPSARFVNFYPFDENADGIDMLDALHPQTILAYGMNGRDLPLAHGAPLRVRVETQLGYKSVKFLDRIVVTNEFDDMGKNGLLQNGWAWYVGI
jgi:DMSO/TMAO reductase YedYZ molybdopterin-dependent catalytic subunit